MSLKNILILSLLIVLSGLPVFAQNAQDIPCFVYHRFGESRYSSTNISLEVFEKQMAWLKANEYTVYTLGEALEKLDKNEAIPDKSVILTVDDGFSSFESGAMPILRKYGYKATLFINTEQVGGSSYLNWESLKRLQKEGIEIGNHSHSHAYFVDQEKEKRISFFKGDIKKARELFKKHMGFQPSLFAFPYGEYSIPMKNELKTMGFQAAAAQHSGVIHQAGDRFALPRFPMGGPYATLNGFKNKAKMHALLLESEPESPLIENQNPPSLQFQVKTEGVYLPHMQTFIGGTKGGSLEKVASKEGTYRLKASKPLTNRRTLYTITAPSKDGKKWYWYSHLWIKLNK